MSEQWFVLRFLAPHERFRTKERVQIPRHGWTFALFFNKVSPKSLFDLGPLREPIFRGDKAEWPQNGYNVSKQDSPLHSCWTEILITV